MPSLSWYFSFLRFSERVEYSKIKSNCGLLTYIQIFKIWPKKDPDEQTGKNLQKQQNKTMVKSIMCLKKYFLT